MEKKKQLSKEEAEELLTKTLTESDKCINGDDIENAMYNLAYKTVNDAITKINHDYNAVEKDWEYPIKMMLVTEIYGKLIDKVKEYGN